MDFYVGVDIHQAKAFPKAILSINRLARRNRLSGFEANDWILDSGAFTELTRFGEYSTSTAAYAESIRRWAVYGNCVAAVSQDYLCTDAVLEKTKSNVSHHQEMTIERYLRLKEEDLPVYLMPVLQGSSIREFEEHAKMYVGLLERDAWVGIGSIFQIQKKPDVMADLLISIGEVANGWKVHGFGLKTTALKNAEIRSLLHSADSYSWSYHARKNNRNQNSIVEAEKFRRKIERFSQTQNSIQQRLF